MDESTIVAGSFTLHTGAATDTETISNVSSATVGGITTATVVATGAKISPTYTDYVKVACGSETNSPKNAGTEANSDCGNIGFIMIQGPVVISEVQISGGTEGTAKQEFIEFYNRTGSAIDLDGYQLKYANASGVETVLMADLDGTHADTDIPAQGFYVVSNAAYTPALPGTDTWADTIDIPANATILLYNAQGAVVDMLGFGSDSSNPSVLREGQQATFGAELSLGQSLERKAVPTSTSATMSVGGAHAGWGNGQDSNNNDFDFALRATPQPQGSGSGTETPTQYQNQPPTINHMPIAQVVSSETQAATVFAMMADAETPPTSLTPQLFYKTPSGDWTAVTGQYVSGQPFKFTIPAAATGSGSGTAFIYYLKVTDGDSASACMYATGGPCGTNDATARAAGAPWTVTSVSGGTWTNSIKGRVVISGTTTGIDNASVTLRGAGLTFVTNSATDGDTSGAFTFSNIPGGIFRVEALASGYLDGWLDGVPSKTSGAAYTDWSIGLTAGSGGGQGGDINKPMVTFSAPMDGMMGAPTKINIPSGTGQIEAPIMIGFSKDMDTTTITSDNIKIYPVTAAGLGTALTGISVAYQAQAGTATLTDRGNRTVEFGPDRKAILYSATALSANSQYAVVLSTGVKDTAGNVLEGNKPGGGHAISFTTGGDFSNYSGTEMATGFQTFMAGGGGGQFTPPYVTGSTPSNGAKNVPTNAKIVVNFSQPMDSVGINATNSQGTYVKLYDTNYQNSGSGQNVTVASITLDTTTKQSATITVGGSGLAANHSNYAIRVLGGAKSATGMSMAMPDQANTVMYQADFQTGSGSDTSAPTVLSTTLQTYTSTAPCATGVNVCVSGVPTNVGVIEVSFSKDMDASTINSSNITLKSGNTSVSTTVSYDPLSRSVKIVPDTVLYTTTTYTLTVTTNVKAMNTAALGSNYVVSFATSSAVDQVAPFLQYANGDDYKLAVTFSEPMQAAKATDTNNWASSVLNPTNYVLYTDNGPPPTGQTALYFANANLSTATTTETGGPLTFKYDAAYNTVVIEGLKLMAGAVRGGFRLWVKNVKDLSGNIIQDTTKPSDANDFGANSSGGGVMNSNDTFGMIGPGGGGMSGPPTTAMLSGGTMQVTAFGGKDPSMMGFKPINVNPVNMLAGQESLYMIDIPLSQAIPDAGQIVLTFPLGFDVTNATDADPSKLWSHKDLNGPGLGTVTIASLSADATARMITITLDVAGATATQANDFLHLEIDRIKNTTKATDGDMSTGVTMGSGYQVDILTKTSATGGRTLETLKSMPFFIKAAGTSTLTGSLQVKNAAGANVAVDADIPLFLSSPMTGPLKALVDFDVGDGGSKTYAFSNLPTGMYMLGTEPIQTISGTDYYTNLSPIPQSIEITAGTTTKNIIFQAQSSTNKPNLRVLITGTFTNEQIDIFAGGPSGFAVKTVALDGTYTIAAPSDNTVYLPGLGTFMVGMGPTMPKGPQQAGPPPMPNWMPPQSIEVTASGSGPNWTWKDYDGAATDDANATDGIITLGVTTANKTISGHVYGPTGTTGIQNAEVFAYSPVGGMGSHATSDANGAFTLKVTDGSYQVGAFISGMPPSPETSVEVKTVASVTTIYANGVATSDVILRIQNPESMYTISGKVTDGTNVIKDASVYARRTDGPGNVGTKTDSMGKYILYVQAGTWTVGAFLPQYGNLTEQTVTVTTASEADIDFAATTTNYNTVSDRVYKDVNADGNYDADTDTLIANAHVDFVNSTTGYTNTAITDSNGLYKTNLPDGTYTATAWSPDTGKIPPQTVTVTDDINVDGSADIMTLGDTKTITVNFVDELGAPVTLDKVYVQMDKLGTKDVSNEVNRDDVSSLTLNVPAGTGFQYALDIDIPGITDSALEITSPTAGVVTAQDIVAGGAPEMYQVKVEDNRTINVTVPTLYTVSGVAKDNAGNPLSNTIINIKKPGGSDVSLEVKTNSSGEYSVDLPASGDTPYLFQIDRSGYIDTGVSVAVTADAPNTDFDATKAILTIEGQIKIGATGVEGAKVYAKELGGGFASTETIDAQGNYVLSVAAGDWKISATSDTYQEKEYQNASGQDIVIPVTTTNTTGINITLDTAKSGLAGLINADVTPSSGATFEHSAANLEVFAPQNAIATSQASYQLENKEVSNISSSPTADIIGGEAVDLVAYQPSGSKMVPLTENFVDDVTIEKKYAIAELTAEGIDTFVEADAVKMSYFDEAASNWEPVPTNVTYLNNSEQPVIPTATLSNVSYIVYAGISDHMTVYSPTNPKPDGLAPAAPTGLQVTAGTGSSVTISWTAPTLNADGSGLSDLLGYEIYRSTNGTNYVQINASDVLTTSYSDTSVSGWTSYYYEVTAADTGGIESDPSSAVRTCSNITVTNGTVANTCTITCNAGYVQEGQNCVLLSVGGAIGPVFTQQVVTPVTEEEEEVEKPVAEMTPAEIEVKITEVKAQIIAVQTQLITLIKKLIEIIVAQIAELTARL